MQIKSLGRPHDRGLIGLLVGLLYAVFCALLWSPPLWASGAGLKIDSGWMQGAPIFGSVRPGSTLTLGSRRVEVSQNGKFVLGLAYDAAVAIALEVRTPEGAVEHHEFAVEQRAFQTQRISGLPKAMVTPPERVLKRIRGDRERVIAARSHLALHENSFDAFVWPVAARITGEFGAARILNGVPRQPHFGIDMAAAQGTPVRAPSGGIVRMAERDLYYTGGTIILDHGFGLSTTYLHLSALDVAIGQRVEQGEIIGKVGQTGRATGPHLCWRANWFDVRVDPSLLVGKRPIRKGGFAK